RPRGRAAGTRGGATARRHGAGRAVRRADRATGRPRPAACRIIGGVSPVLPTPKTKPAAAPKPAKAKPKPKRKVKRRRPDPALAWAKRLARTRPRLLEDTLDALTSIYGPQARRRLRH